MEKTGKIILSAIAAAVFCMGSPYISVDAKAAQEVAIEYNATIGYGIEMTVPANSTETFYFKSDDNYCTKGYYDKLNNIEVTGTIQMQGDNTVVASLTTDDSGNWIALEKGAAYAVNVTNSANTNANIGLKLNKDTITRGALHTLGGYISEQNVYEVTGDTFSTDSGMTSQMKSVGYLPGTISYVLDLTKTKNDYKITESLVSDSFEKKSSIVWCGNLTGVNRTYDYTVSCSSKWSDGRHTASEEILEHGKKYTLTYSYTYPEDPDFIALVENMGSEERDHIARMPSVKFVLEKIKEENKTSATVRITENGSTMEFTVGDKKATLKKATGSKVIIPSTITVNKKKIKVTKIDDKAFSKNRKLEEITVGDNITEIPADCFKGCSKLKKATLGKKVKKVNTGAFQNCSKLNTLTIKSEIKVEPNSFKKCKTITLKYKNITKKKAKAIAKLITSKGKAKRTKL